MTGLYEKKLRQLQKAAEQKAQQALDRGNSEEAASYYEQCGDILTELAKNHRGRRKKQKETLAQQYYELSDNLLGRSDSLKRTVPAGEGGNEPGDTDFSSYVERFIQDAAVTWDDVAGLSNTKKQLKESFALAAIQDKPPAVESLHSILLYGPPGTGKSLLAAAVAGSHDFTFFNVKLSQALSKYYGESSKIVSEIFAAAREQAPSIVFFDELDAVAMSRGTDLDEASRRLLSTLLTELSGFDAQNDDLLFLAATNAPWDIDPAVLSRMERAIYVPLPGEETAERIIELNTVEEGINLSMDVTVLAQECVEQGYSGREVKNVCHEAIRHMIDEQNPGLEELSEQPAEAIESYTLQTRPLQQEDFDHAFSHITPKTENNTLHEYESWENES